MKHSDRTKPSVRGLQYIYIYIYIHIYIYIYIYMPAASYAEFQ